MAENRVENDHPPVIVLPPLLYGGALIISLVLRWLWPLPIEDRAISLWPGAAIVLLAVAILFSGRRALRMAGTNVNPRLPTTAIVSSGPYRFTRNPLYVGLTFRYLGLTLALNTWWGLILLVPVLGIMHWGVVLREEGYLESKFGEGYREYRSRVRRYL